jgi:uncharacterized protein (DUF885 family)
MKKFFKWLGLSFGIILALTALAGTWLWYGPLPNFDWALNRGFAKMVVQSPETLTQLHVLEQAGITFHQDELDDESQAAGDAALAEMTEIGKELRGFDRDSLPYQQQLSYDMVDWMLTRMEDGARRWRYYDYPLNQMSGVQSGFPSFMESAHSIASVGDARDYNTRMSKLGVKFSQVLEGLRIREEKGILPPTFVVDKVLEEMTNFVSTPPRENILYTSFKTKLEEAKIPEADQAKLLEENERQIESSVYPAYKLFIDYYTRLRPKTNTDDGVWKLPDGDEFYAFMLQLMTTSEMSPAEIHDLGLAEVDRIQGEMRVILAAEGYDVSRPIGELLKEISEEDRFMYPDTDAGREQILVDYQAILDEISAGLDDWFNIRPEAGLKVERVPEFKEKTAPGAYYNPPAMDGSRPGVFYANLYDIKATPKFGMRTLAYHEGIPGHHFQVALSMEQPDLPLFRKMSPFTAYVEGWALYAERVAWEAGFEEDPYSNLGRLRAELFRAVRLVVDTGIHHSRWTREQAIDYMLTNLGNAESDAVAEIERYIVMPGQACAYKVGMIEILKLRKHAQDTLGDKFDIREFHDVVLKNGAMPLAILNRVINDWLAQKQAS